MTRSQKTKFLGSQVGLGLSASIRPHHLKGGDHVPVAALGIISNSRTAYPDDKRSIRLGLGATHILRVTTKGFEGAASAQGLCVLLCHPKMGTWEWRA